MNNVYVFENYNKKVNSNCNRSDYNRYKNRSKSNVISNEIVLKVILLGLSVMLLTFTISVLFFSKKANAEDYSGKQFKYFHTVTIEEGDTIWSLAKESGYSNNSEFVKEVMEMNGLKSDKIIEGQWIVVPYYSDEVKF